MREKKQRAGTKLNLVRGVRKGKGILTFLLYVRDMAMTQAWRLSLKTYRKCLVSLGLPASITHRAYT